MELEGKIILDLPLEEGISKAGNPWKKKSWVLETMGQYPRRVKFDVFGDRATTLVFELNKTYIVSVDAESREFNGRWYTDLRAFAARESVQNSFNTQDSNNTEFIQTQTQFTQTAPIDLPPADETEDLPF